MPMEADAITEAMGERAIEAAKELAPMCHEAVRGLENSFYVTALDGLAELKEHIDRTRTLISILRDWQAVNERASKDKPEAQPSAQERST
jgi:hypothetical protein